MGHSVKRKEDPRFIRGAGEYIDDFNLPGQLWLDIVRSPVRPRDRSRASTRPRRSRSRASPRSSPAPTSRRPASHWMPTLAGDKQMVLPTDTVMYQAQEVAAVVATSRYAAADGVAAVMVDYEPLPVIVDPHKALEPRRVRPPARPRPGQAEQPHLALGVGRRGEGGRRPGRRRRHDLRGHLHPADPRRLDRDVRLRRRLGRRPRAS